MGGAEVFTREVLKRWVKRGHTVTLFTSKYKGGKREEVVDGVHIVRDGGKYSVYRKARKHYAASFSKEGYDVVIDEINTEPFHTLRFVAKGEKIVALIHQLAREYWFYETPFPISYIGFHFLEPRWLKKYRRTPTVTVSESSRADLINLGFEKIAVVGEGLNFEPLGKLGQKESQPVMVYSGRLRKAKRPDHALKAFEIVKGEIPETKFWIIGKGYLKNRLAESKCEGIGFFETISDTKRRELIQRAWVLVNPSVREGFGLNVIEANALGVPCVAYDVPGLRDSILDGKTGLLVEPGNVEALAKALAIILTDGNLRNELSENALTHSRAFSWDRVADNFMSFIRSA